MDRILLIFAICILMFLYGIFTEITIIKKRLIQWQETWEKRNGIDHSDVEDILGN